jgi:hypothetical protein
MIAEKEMGSVPISAHIQVECSVTVTRYFYRADFMNISGRKPYGSSKKDKPRGQLVNRMQTTQGIPKGNVIEALKQGKIENYPTEDFGEDGVAGPLWHIRNIANEFDYPELPSLVELSRQLQKIKKSILKHRSRYIETLSKRFAVVTQTGALEKFDALLLEIEQERTGVGLNIAPDITRIDKTIVGLAQIYEQLGGNSSVQNRVNGAGRHGAYGPFCDFVRHLTDNRMTCTQIRSVLKKHTKKFGTISPQKTSGIDPKI